LVAFLLEEAIRLFGGALMLLIFVRAILSWFPEPQEGILRDIYYLVIRVSNTFVGPIIEPIRNLIQKSPLGGPGMMIDFSPIIAFILIQFVQGLLISIVRTIF